MQRLRPNDSGIVAVALLMAFVALFVNGASRGQGGVIQASTQPSTAATDLSSTRPAHVLFQKQMGSDLELVVEAKPLAQEAYRDLANAEMKAFPGGELMEIMRAERLTMLLGTPRAMKIIATYDCGYVDNHILGLSDPFKVLDARIEGRLLLLAVRQNRSCSLWLVPMTGERIPILGNTTFPLIKHRGGPLDVTAATITGSFTAGDVTVRVMDDADKEFRREIILKLDPNQIRRTFHVASEQRIARNVDRD